MNGDGCLHDRITAGDHHERSPRANTCFHIRSTRPASGLLSAPAAEHTHTCTHEQCAPVICNSLPTTSDTFEVLFMYTVHVNHLAAMFSSAVRTTRGHPRSLSLSLLLQHQSSSAILCAHCWPPFVCNTNKRLWHTNADKCETYSVNNALVRTSNRLT